jgi:hypothetical protein
VKDAKVGIAPEEKKEEEEEKEKEEEEKEEEKEEEESAADLEVETINRLVLDNAAEDEAGVSGESSDDSSDDEENVNEPLYNTGEDDAQVLPRKMGDPPSAFEPFKKEGAGRKRQSKRRQSKRRQSKRSKKGGKKTKRVKTRQRSSRK